MTSRERMMIAIGNGVPDRVPVAPDMSNMIPCRLTGKPFWCIYAENDPPLWRAYLDAVDYFGIDGWFIYGYLDFRNSRVSGSHTWLEQSETRWVGRHTLRTPAGDLTSVMVYPRDNPPTVVEKMIKDPERDLPALYALWDFDSVDTTGFEAQRAEVGERAVVGTGLVPGGFHIWEGLFEGGVETLALLQMEHPEILDELDEQTTIRYRRELPYHLQARPDFILTGGSGSITMASPKLWRKYSLPGLQEITAAAKQAGVLTMVHSCGKERYLVEACAKETDLDCINPLEIPPMGDCNLKEIKQLFGDRLSLMGNLHTTEVMLRGTPGSVKEAARQAIEDAAENGGFILSTGDQCGRDTPDANIAALLEAAEAYGRYA